MNRRQMIAATSAAGLAASAAATANASSSGESGGDPAAAVTANVTGVSLPVIADGRLRNYVFVGLRLHLKPGKAPEDIRAKEAFFRDALVRTAHRVPFTLADDWNRLHEGAINAAMLAISGVVMGPGFVDHCEVVAQTPRQRVNSPAV
jgi:hypothetical protein